MLGSFPRFQVAALQTEKETEPSKGCSEACQAHTEETGSGAERGLQDGDQEEAGFPSIFQA